LTGQIDSTSNLNSSKVWLFTGKNDLVVNSGKPDHVTCPLSFSSSSSLGRSCTEVMVKAKQFYQGYVPNSSIHWVANISAEHAWITDYYGSDCDYLGP
jgi:oxalate decarboxylase/phosphoglucose isomerase-like protein (cupin superfamily)